MNLPNLSPKWWIETTAMAANGSSVPVNCSIFWCSEGQKSTQSRHSKRLHLLGVLESYSTLKKVFTLVFCLQIAIGICPLFGSDTRVEVTTLYCDMFGIADFDWSDSDYLTFTPYTQRPLKYDYWSLLWHGIVVPIPDLKYTHLLIGGNDDNAQSIILGSENTDIVILLRYDRYDPVAFNKDWYLNGEFPQLDVTHMGLLERAYSFTPEDIDCSSEDPASQLVIIASQVAKHLLALNGESRVHKSVGDAKGILLQTDLGDLTETSYTATEHSHGNNIVSITYRAKHSSGLAEFGLLVSQIALNSQGSPGWLKEFDGYLRLWDIDGLKSLAKRQGWKVSDNRPGLTEEQLEKALADPKVQELIDKYSEE